MINSEGLRECDERNVIDISLDLSKKKKKIFEKLQKKELIKEIKSNHL